MKIIYVIECKDHNDNESYVIGVASSPEKALEMCKEYFGPNHEELLYRDVRESGIEWIRRWKVEGIADEMYECIITLGYFSLDEL